MINDQLEKLLNETIDYPAQVFPEIIHMSDNPGYCFSLVIYVKIYSSFYASIELIKKGYLIEANAVLRQILEQLAYCIAIYDKNYEEMDKISVTKSINSLSLLNEKYKALYGLLSRMTHFNVSDMREILTAEEEQDLVVKFKIRIIDKNHDMNTRNIALLFLLLQIYYEIGIFLMKSCTTNEMNEIADKISIKLNYWLIMLKSIDIKVFEAILQFTK
jgi:hypothetical protein